MRINHNISALKANNQLSRNDNKMSKSLERLTSGLKINSAADDAAGMAISQKMKTQIAGLEKASNNASDGISVIQTAEGALDEVNSCLQRMRELSVQSANGTNTMTDRQAIQEEIDALNAEIQRISESTEFNTKKLLDGTIDRKSYSNNTSVSIISVSDSVATDSYGISVTQDARKAVVLGNTMGTGATGDQKITAAQAGTVNINGEDVKINEGDSYDEVYQKLRETAANCSIYCFATSNNTYSATNASLEPYAGYTVEEVNMGMGTAQKLAFVSYDYGSEEEVSVLCDSNELASLLGLSTNMVTAKGIDVKADVNPTIGFTNTATVSTKGNEIIITNNDGFEMHLEAKPGTVGTVFDDMTVADQNAGTTPTAPTGGTSALATISVLDAGPMSLHIGANAYQTMEVTIPEVTPKTLGVDTVNISTEKGAQKAITAVSDAIDSVSIIRSKLGAYQNRLEHAISNIDTADLNMTESLSRIEDTDMAEEMALYTQYNVLVQAGTSMLAQANERPQQVLSLLQ